MPSNIKIQPVILNYNLPKEADNIYETLQKNGYENILSVDNGSDKAPKSKYANFILPWNIRLSGQLRLSILYLNEYFKSDFYFIITTSVELDRNLDYKETIENDIKYLSRKFNIGMIYPSLKIDESYFTGSKERVMHQLHTADKSGFSLAFKPREMAYIISKRLVALALENGLGFFNTSLKIGHGINLELLYWARKHNMINPIDHNIWVYWKEKITYKKGLGGEPVDVYQKNGLTEKTRMLNMKYGKDWENKFINEYLRQTRITPFPYQDCN